MVLWLTSWERPMSTSDFRYFPSRKGFLTLAVRRFRLATHHRALGLQLRVHRG
jgi:hypothetical protein